MNFLCVISVRRAGRYINIFSPCLGVFPCFFSPSVPGGGEALRAGSVCLPGCLGKLGRGHGPLPGFSNLAARPDCSTAFLSLPNQIVCPL